MPAATTLNNVEAESWDSDEWNDRIDYLMDLQDRLDAGEELTDEELNELLDEVLDDAYFDDISLTAEYKDREQKAFAITCLIGVGFIGMMLVMYCMLARCKAGRQSDESEMKQRQP